MTATLSPPPNRPLWFVGSTFHGHEDQTGRFIQNGIWENGYDNKYTELVKAMAPGDLIAIKSAYTRKHQVPFDNRGHTVSVMKIKAIGTIRANPKDGRTVEVNWVAGFEPKEWYFSTSRQTVWRVEPNDWTLKQLVDFTFSGIDQDLDGFRNLPNWRERFGDKGNDEAHYGWTAFYEAIADQLLKFKDDRSDLIRFIHNMHEREVPGITLMTDQYADGTSGHIQDICPFTTLGLFNRGIRDDKRHRIAQEFATFLGVDLPVPNSFDAIPRINNQNSWFFSYSKNRGENDIDTLWEMFDTALRYADNNKDDWENQFVDIFKKTRAVRKVKWNLTIGLYWIRPWFYLTLDGQSRPYIRKQLALPVQETGGPQVDQYLKLREILESRFNEDHYSVHSFPELSYAAWRFQGGVDDEEVEELDGEPVEEIEIVQSKPTFEPYTVQNIVEDGCFIPADTLDTILKRLKMKKNLILQGPPGTGKTWLGKRLAYALIGEKIARQVRALQFHPNMSYEDFVRGWRPDGKSGLTLANGPLMEMIEEANENPKETFVLIIEEINRGNPAQIFGEMLTLLEADKRTPEAALELSYRQDPGEKVFVPKNLYLIGTMNVADRSLALVDLALRRRFAFVDLEPQLGTVWKKWVHGRNGVPNDVLSEIQQRLNRLNTIIEEDATLGRQFRVGHSYVTPPSKETIDDAWDWYRQVVQTEIGPLLDEYWFDNLSKAKDETKRLIEGL